MSSSGTVDNPPAHETDADPRSTIASILSIDVDPRSGLLDLTPYLKRDRFLGSGGYGEVYAVKWRSVVSGEQVPSLPRLVMKLMRPIPLNDDLAKKKREKNLKREIRVMCSIKHQNIAPLIGFALLNNDMNRPCLISLWIPNGTVRSYSVHCNMKRLCELMSGVANGLSYLHDHGIIHGDVKSDNVLVDQYGIPKVIDFGLSRMLENSTLWQTSTNVNAPGTIRWQSPELMDGTHTFVTEKADVYAFAMTCLEILTGEVPFVQYSRDSEVLFAVMIRKEYPARPSRRDLPEELWSLLAACWTPDAARRLSFKPIIQVLLNLAESENHSHRRRRPYTILDVTTEMGRNSPSPLSPLAPFAPPPAGGSTGGGDRVALMGAIHEGHKLRKTMTNDRSSPALQRASQRGMEARETETNDRSRPATAIRVLGDSGLLGAIRRDVEARGTETNDRIRPVTAGRVIDNSALLGAIQRGVQLRKAVTNDRGSPTTADRVVDNSALLGAIQRGVKLRKTVTDDRSSFATGALSGYLADGQMPAAWIDRESESASTPQKVEADDDVDISVGQIIRPLKCLIVIDETTEYRVLWAADCTKIMLA